MGITKRTVFLWSTAALSACLLGPNNLVNAVFLVWTLASVVYFTSSKSWTWHNLKQPNSLAFLGLFLILALGLLWSSTPKEGAFLLERSMMFVLFPLVYTGLSRIEDQKSAIHYAEKGFVIGVLLSVLVGIGYAIEHLVDYVYGRPTQHTTAKILNEIELTFSYWGFTGPMGLHAGYYAFFLLFAIFIIAEAFRTSRYRFRGIKTIAILLILLLFNMKSSSAVFAMLLLSAVYIHQIKNHIKSKHWAALILGLFGAGVALIVVYKFGFLHTPYRNYGMLAGFVLGIAAAYFLFWTPRLLPPPRYFILAIVGMLSAIFIIFSIYEFDVPQNSVNGARAYTWKAAVLAVAENPLWGTGTGGAFDAVQQKFSEIDFQNGIDAEYNEHNQYLRYWLEAGIVGLLAFLTLIFAAYRAAFRSKYFPFLVLVFSLVIFSFTESCLVRRHFISLYSLMLPLYGLYFAKHTSEDYNATT